MMEKVPNPSNYVCHPPLSEPFRKNYCYEIERTENQMEYTSLAEISVDGYGSKWAILPMMIICNEDS
jgi:hypothetical protein